MTDNKWTYCGTRRGYMAHNKVGDKACDACREANTLYQRERRRDPEQMRKDREANAARLRALWRLSKLHPGQFHILVEEEMAS